MINRFNRKYRSVPPSTGFTIEKTNIGNGVLKVVFEAEAHLEQTLQCPYQVAHIAVANGCDQVLLYVRGDSELKNILLAKSLLVRAGWVR